MDEAEDGFSTSRPAGRVLGLINRPLPPPSPRGRVKLDRAWARGVRKSAREQGEPGDIEKRLAAFDEIMAFLTSAGIQLLGRDLAAVGLYEHACATATRRRPGRPRGSKTYSPDELDLLRRMVMVLEVRKLRDGSALGRSRAIAIVLEGEPAERRAALRVHFHRHLPRK